jgi:cytochrome P450 family 142 subfamily A polypeptide 1
MINMDPPAHTARRRVVNRGFTTRRVQDHEPFIRATVTKLIDAVCEHGQCDLVRDIATPLPMYMIGELMGLPRADHDQLLHWSDLFATGGAAVLDDVRAAIAEYWAYILGIASERRQRPTDDLIGLIVNTRSDGDGGGDGGELTDADIVFETMLILVGGDETTRHVISGGAAELMARPHQLHLLHEDLNRVGLAVEEMLRWVSPVKNMNRTATCDVELGGQVIREGDRVLLLYPSANRDEKVFEDPFRFDVTRKPNNHVAFGAPGRHHCLGSALARLELRVTFEELLTRLPDLALADTEPLRQRRGNFVLGLESLPVRFTPTARRGA